MSSNGSYNLTVDGELRYVVQWFEEWSDFQREDFVPYLVSYLTQQAGGMVYVNGLISAMAQINPGQDKPMSLFQCRVKLFNEWCPKWPEEFKSKLLERLEQSDSAFGARIRTELEANAKPLNGSLEDPDTQLTDTGTARDLEEKSEQAPIGLIVNAEPVIVAPSNAILVADED
uniref:Uncharacterized protein n=1 Tax=Anopheles epiroticus TaxID=199890 RepID=A0A182PPY5_9DIPT